MFARPIVIIAIRMQNQNFKIMAGVRVQVPRLLSDKTVGSDLPIINFINTNSYVKKSNRFI